MNSKDCTKIAADLEYIRGIFDIRYRLNISDMTRLKNEHEIQTKGQVEMTLDKELGEKYKY